MNTLPPDFIGRLGNSLGMLLPEWLVLTALVLALTLTAIGGRIVRAISVLTVALLSLALFALLAWRPLHLTLFQGMLVSSPWSSWLQMLTLGSAWVLSVFAWAYPPLQALPVSKWSRHGMGEFWVLMLAPVLGMLVLAWAQHLLLLYVALELVSLPSYILAGYFRTRAGAEASVKYVIYGATSSALLLFGVSLLYGTSGVLFAPVTATEAAQPLAWVGLGLILVGVAFKIAAAPLHFWAPDVYQASASPVAALLATIGKLAGFAWLGVLSIGWGRSAVWYYGLVALALLSMTWGTIAALRQTDYRRLLAYSGVSQTGFILLAWAGPTDWLVNAGFFLFAYLLLTLGGFLSGSLLAEAAGSTDMRAWRGMAQRHTWLSGAFAVLMIGLIGLPPTVGFIAKLQLFLPLVADIQAHQSFTSLVLVSAGLIYTVVALAVYLRPVAWLFFGAGQPGQWHHLGAWHHYVRLALVLLLASLTIWFGLRDFDDLIDLLRS